ALAQRLSAAAIVRHHPPPGSRSNAEFLRMSNSARGRFVLAGPLPLAKLSWAQFRLNDVSRASRDAAKLFFPRKGSPMYRFLPGLLVLVGLALGSLPAGEARTPDPQQTTLVKGNTQFALDLYGKLRDKEGNLFFSPYSISSALAMTYAGA